MKQKPYDMNATPNLNVITLVEKLLTTQKNAHITLLSIEQKLTKTSPPKPTLPKLPEEPEDNREVLRRGQVMDILKISERTYYRHIRNGILVPRKLGKGNYFYYEDLTEALEYSRIRGYI